MRYQIYCSGNDAFLDFDEERKVAGWGGNDCTFHEAELRRIEYLLRGDILTSDGLVWVMSIMDSMKSSMELVRKRGWSVFAIPEIDNVFDVSRMERLEVKPWVEQVTITKANVTANINWAKVFTDNYGDKTLEVDMSVKPSKAVEYIKIPLQIVKDMVGKA